MSESNGFRRYLVVTKGLSPKTAVNYVRTVEEFERGGGDLCPDDIERWVTAKGGAPSSTTARLAAFKAYAKHQHLPDPTADLERPKRRHRGPRPVPDWRDRIESEDLTFQSACTLLALTGLRIAEAEAIDVEDPGACWELRVTGKGDKTRQVPLVPEAQDALVMLGGRWLRCSRSTFQRRCRRLGFTPHQLRHERATSLVRAGADIGAISKLLGHSNPGVTMDSYAQYDLGPIRAALELDVKRGAA